MSDPDYRVLPWHGTMKNETRNLVENLRDNIIFKHSECEDNFNVENIGRKNSVKWNPNDLIIKWNKNQTPLFNQPSSTSIKGLDWDIVTGTNSPSGV